MMREITKVKSSKHGGFEDEAEQAAASAAAL